MGILTIDPFKALTAEVMAMEGCVGGHESIQIGYQTLNSRVRFPLKQFPMELGVMIPFMPLRQFSSHEEHLLARMSPHVGEQKSQISEFLPEITWHLSDERSFSVYDFVVREWQLKIF